MRIDYSQLGCSLGDLVADKQRQYGDSVGRSAALLEALWPGGVPVADYDSMLLCVRIFDKLSRIATANGDDLEDPWQDIAGYGLLGWAQSMGERGAGPNGGGK